MQNVFAIPTTLSSRISQSRSSSSSSPTAGRGPVVRRFACTQSAYHWLVNDLETASVVAVTVPTRTNTRNPVVAEKPHDLFVLLPHAVNCVRFCFSAVRDFLFANQISREPMKGFAPNSQGRRVWALALPSLNVKVLFLTNNKILFDLI